MVQDQLPVAANLQQCSHDLRNVRLLFLLSLSSYRHWSPWLAFFSWRFIWLLRCFLMSQISWTFEYVGFCSSNPVSCVIYRWWPAPPVWWFQLDPTPSFDSKSRPKVGLLQWLQTTDKYQTFNILLNWVMNFCSSSTLQCHFWRTKRSRRLSSSHVEDSCVVVHRFTVFIWSESFQSIPLSKSPGNLHHPTPFGCNRSTASHDFVRCTLTTAKQKI